MAEKRETVEPFSHLAIEPLSDHCQHGCTSHQCSLSIIVPVFNEERTITKIMQAITTALPESQIIYVDDGSRDRSLELLKTNARPTDRVVSKRNGGKGSAIREGIKYAMCAFTVIQDADLEYDPKEILSLLKEAQDHPGSIVFGSRFLRPNPNLYRLYLLGNKTVTWVANVLFRGHLTDTYTCYKLFPTAILKSLPLTARGFELEAELSVWPLKMKKEIREVAISYRPRSFTEGKKIGWKDAVKGMWTMFRIRWSRKKAISE